MKIRDHVRVRYVGEDDPISLRTGKIYDARLLKKGWYGIVDESGEEYAYHPGVFEKIDCAADYTGLDNTDDLTK